MSSTCPSATGAQSASDRLPSGERKALAQEGRALPFSGFAKQRACDIFAGPVSRVRPVDLDEEPPQHEAPYQQHSCHGSADPQQPEGQLRVDLTDHSAEVHAEPGDEGERQEATCERQRRHGAVRPRARTRRVPHTARRRRSEWLFTDFYTENPPRFRENWDWTHVANA